MKIGSVIYQNGAHIFPGDEYWFYSIPEETSKFKLIILHGGGDISPTLYGQKPVHADASDVVSLRDKKELDIVKEAIRLGIPILGICRGAQLLCAHAGGTLFQHVDGHNAGNHEIVTSEGKYLITNSVHHQAMRLNSEGIMMAQTSTRIARSRFADKAVAEDTDEPEVEAVWWPNLNAIGIQGHPEYLGITSPLVKYCRDLMEKYLNVHFGV
jgi:putative glutamine amidotransferase